MKFLGWIVFSCGLMSFIEHQVHARLMHRRNFLSERSPKYKRVFESHAIVHHKHYSKIFHDEPVPPGEDKEIRLTVHKAPIKGLPAALILACFSWKAAAAFTAVITAHHWIWNKIHLEMHKPEQRKFSKWPVYRFLARYHWLHHRYPDKNFNVVFPFADYVLGTVAKATPEDERAMILEFESNQVAADAADAVSTGLPGEEPVASVSVDASVSNPAPQPVAATATVDLTA